MKGIVLEKRPSCCSNAHITNCISKGTCDTESSVDVDFNTFLSGVVKMHAEKEVEVEGLD
jgi:hypothetical protein